MTDTTRMQVANLSFHAGGKCLLDTINLMFQPGELVGLIGPNGAGKSTLLRHMAGLEAILSSGSVTLSPYGAIDKIAAKLRGSLIGYMPQNFAPAWDYRVEDVIEMGWARGNRSTSLSSLLTAGEVGSLLDRRWSMLSGGEAARALLTAVLAADPPVVLADEPGAGLDIRHRIELLHRLHTLAREKVVVVVLHDIDLALRYCDRLIGLKEGRVHFDDKADIISNGKQLDDLFDIKFQRLPANADDGPVLPIWVHDLHSDQIG